VAVVCIYEEREEGEVVSTGRLTLERPPAVGDVLRLGRRRVRVEDVLPVSRDEIRLVLQRL
jgi:hypothetical protein